jgi:lipopolysaccharide/colanic/teichoic acid biosynthesis glycosyltransferase
MDLLFLPKTDQREKSVSARYNFLYYSSPKPESADFQYSGFYYIGKDDAHIEKLVGIYKGGYALDTLEAMRTELLRCVDQGKNLPEVIICEAVFDFSATRQFCQFLRQDAAFKCIPFLLDGSGLSAKDFSHYRKNTQPDDILMLDGMDEKAIDQKVRFLRKIKSGGSGDLIPRIEEKLPFDRVSRPLSKRVFDIVVSGVALLILSPLFLLIALAIRLESRGPVFYISKRAGRGYKIFNFYKFRTMIHNAERKISELTHMNQYITDDRGPMFFKINNDPRITRVGKFLRNTSLDELPQLINVFLGKMSLVGNRPLPLYEAQALTTDNYAERFMAPAGITGLWQVKKRGNKDMSSEERINIDIAYAAKFNFATDLWIIANTPSALLQKANV